MPASSENKTTPREWSFWKYLAYVRGPVVTSGGRPKRARPMRRKK